MVWIHAVTEGPSTTRMNPTSDAKLRLLARHISLEPDHRVLDIGSGRCGPALLFARDFGCRITAVEPYEPFMEDAQRLVAEAGLSDRVEFALAKGADFPIEPNRYDAAMCLGATWAWGGLDGTLAALASGVRAEGHVVAGEPFVRPGLREYEPPHNLSLTEIIERFEAQGLAVISVIRSSDDDWDEYGSVRVANLLDWVRENSTHEDADEVRRWRREHAADLAVPGRGWAIVAARKTVHQ